MGYFIWAHMDSIGLHSYNNVIHPSGSATLHKKGSLIDAYNLCYLVQSAHTQTYTHTQETWLRVTTSSGTSDNKVGIMMTLSI